MPFIKHNQRKKYSFVSTDIQIAVMLSPPSKIAFYLIKTLQEAEAAAVVQ